MNKKWRKMCQLDRQHQRTSHSNVDHSQQATCTVDECVLHLTRSMLRTTLEERTYQSRNSRNPKRRASKLWEEISTLNWGPGFGVERVSVGPQTLNEGNKRGDWTKQWLMTTELRSTSPRCTEKNDLKSKLHTAH